MLRTGLIPLTILEELFEAGYTIGDIKNMTAEEAFEAYCCWNGLIGWGGKLINALDDLRALEV